MNWEHFYLTCFLIGLALTAVSMIAGADLHLHLPFNWPHLHFGSHHHHASAGPVNMTTILMFLTWFGGAGWLITHYRGNLIVAAFLISCAAGLIGASVVYYGLIRVIIADERPLIASDFDMIGMLGKLTMPIREGGVGELIYSQEGTRRSCGARSESGLPIARGTEVVVMRYERGTAWVRPFSDLSSEPDFGTAHLTQHG